MKRTQLLAISLLSFFTLACDKAEVVEPQNQTNSLALKADISQDVIASAEPGRNNLLIEERFETSFLQSILDSKYTQFRYFEPYYRIFSDPTKDYAFKQSTDIRRKGNAAARFEMRNTDKSIIRSEMTGKKAEGNPTRWYGASLYLPAAYWERDDSWDIITQMNGVPDEGEAVRNPAISLLVSRGRLFLKTCYSAKPINTDANRDGQKVWDLGPVEKDKWLDVVFKVKYSYGADGILEMWKNGVKVVSYKGPNSYNDKILPFFKFGIYKRNWEDVSSRVLYVDEVRVGNSLATYKDVAPATI